jgi:hypothetical protein
MTERRKKKKITHCTIYRSNARSHSATNLSTGVEAVGPREWSQVTGEVGFGETHP